jgi:hypothetical protein
MPERLGLAQGQQYSGAIGLAQPNDIRLIQHQYSCLAILLSLKQAENREANRYTLDIAQCKCYQE